MSHTPGPWALRGYQIRAENGTGAHVNVLRAVEIFRAIDKLEWER